MSVDIHPDHSRSTDRETVAAPRGPFARIVLGSLAAGLVAALGLALVVFAGAPEATITGSMLVAFGAGWALLGVLSARMTNRPQRWTVVPAAAMGTTGLALILFTPGSTALTAISWVWPVPVLALAVFVWLRARRDLPLRGRRLLAPVVAFLALAPVAATYENVTVVRDHHTFTAPGTSYDVNGHTLYLECHGQGSPTVVLDNGLGEVTASWARIVASVDSTTRVCAYDRAGQGWSEATTRAQDGVTAARDLHTLLGAAGEHGPYLLVGHSIGGTYAMTYAARYPDQVAGMVLLDSSSPEQFELGSYPAQYAVAHRVLALAPTLNRLGLGRVVAAVSPSHLPSPAADRERALTASAQGAASASAEWQILPELFEQAQALTTLGNRPLAVVTASESLETTDGWAAAQDRLAALSTTLIHRVVDSSHTGLLEDEHGSAAAVRAIDDVVTAVRSHSARGLR
jgi:pimeloyl-ACP methyl ester carboxylesterase